MSYYEKPLFLSKLIESKGDGHDKTYRNHVAQVTYRFRNTPNWEILKKFSKDNDNILDWDRINRFDLLQKLGKNSKADGLIGEIAFNCRPYQGFLHC